MKQLRLRHGLAANRAGVVFMPQSVDDRLVDEVGYLSAIIRAVRSGRLGHHDDDKLLLRIDPEERALRARDRSDARLLAHHETQPEGESVNPHPEFARGDDGLNL